MLVVQTAAEPPNLGKMYLLTINCTWNKRQALKKDVAAKSNLVVAGTNRLWLSHVDLSNVDVLELKPAPLK